MENLEPPRDTRRDDMAVVLIYSQVRFGPIVEILQRNAERAGAVRAAKGRRFQKVGNEVSGDADLMYRFSVSPLHRVGRSCRLQTIFIPVETPVEIEIVT